MALINSPMSPVLSPLGQQYMDRGFEEIKYTQEELEYRSMLVFNANIARQKRDTSHDEFDGMTYIEWWENNNRIRNGFIEPKVNKNDINATTGTSREKTNTMLAALMNLNLEPRIESYDNKGKYVQELGNIMSDLERKSRQLEMPDYEIKRMQIYDEFLTQGTVFTEETFKEFRIPSRTAKKLDMTNLEAMEIKAGLDNMRRFCDTELLVGLNVYLGNIREPNIEKQPYIVSRKLRTRQEANAIYGKWERWKNVPLLKADFVPSNNDYRPYNNWTLIGFRENYVEEIKYFDKWNNNFMILLNGTMMFPVRMDENRLFTVPLSSIHGICEYPIAKGDNEQITNFAYSRSIPSKTRVEQQLLDEFVKAAVLKTRQSYKPPMANFTGEELSSDIFDPATIWDDIDPDKIKPIMKTDGVTQSEFQLLQFTQGLIDVKSVAPILEGQEPNTRSTATQIIEQRRSGMQKMGTTITGIVNFERQRAYLRLCNILTHWTVPQKLADGVSQLQDQYGEISVDSKFDDGNGKRIVKFTEDLPQPSQIYAEEELTAKITGQKVRKNYINPKELKKTLDWNWHIEVIPTPKQDSAVKVAQYAEFLNNAIQLGGILGIKVKGAEAMTRYAVLNNEDPSKVFDLTGGMQMPQPMPGQSPDQNPQMNNQLSSQLTQKIPEQPSINELVKG